MLLQAVGWVPRNRNGLLFVSCSSFHSAAIKSHPFFQLFVAHVNRDCKNKTQSWWKDKQEKYATHPSNALMNYLRTSSSSWDQFQSEYQTSRKDVQIKVRKLHTLTSGISLKIVVRTIVLSDINRLSIMSCGQWISNWYFTCSSVGSSFKIWKTMEKRGGGGGGGNISSTKNEEEKNNERGRWFRCTLIPNSWTVNDFIIDSVMKGEFLFSIR